ncbi:bone marrow stromal antigen 2 [Erethizon dorsatum]
MPPSLYHYLPVPMDEVWKDKDRRGFRLLLVTGRLVLLVGVLGMAATLVYFAVKANSEACQDGLRAEQKCHNVTHHLRDQLTRAQETLQDADAACNSTVENLSATLTHMKTQEQKRQEQVQDLKDEVTDLKRKIREAQEAVRQLRNEINACRQMSPKNASSRRAISIGLVPAALLLLGPAALRP